MRTPSEARPPTPAPGARASSARRAAAGVAAASRTGRTAPALPGPVARLAALALPATLLAIPALPLEAQEPDYPTEPPPPLEARDVELPELGRDTLENGLELVVVENREQPVVSVRLYVPGGSVADAEGKTGLASLVSRVLDKGTDERTAEEIASTVEGVGASLNSGASDEYAFVASSFLTRHMPTVMEVLSDVVRDATFPEEEVETERRRMKSNLQQQLSQPSVLARRHFDRIVYGEHPYGDAPTPETVDAVEREDLVAFHRERYVPGGSLLVFAGDIGLEEAREAARKWFGDWSGEPPADVERPEPPARDSARIYLVHRPGSEQSVVGVGHLGIRPDDPDLHALEVGNRVLGGGANARLFLILREEKGWTYGAYSRLTQQRDVGVFGAQAEVRNPVTDSALVELVHQIRRLRDEPVPEEELDDAKTYLTGNFPLRLETPQQVASRVASVLLRGQEIGYLESYRSRISAVTAGDVREAARRHLHPDRAAIVVVGDASEVYDDLAALGPVTLLDTEGEPLTRAELEVRRSDVELAADRIRAGDFRYSLRVQGNALGEVTIRTERGDGEWRVVQNVSGAGGGQEVSYAFTPSLEPVSVTVRGQAGPVSRFQDLAYERGRVTGTATVPKDPAGGQGRQGPPEMEEVEVDEELEPGTLDSNMDLVAVMAAPLAEGFELQLPVFHPARGVSQLTAEVTGRGTVEVPAGSFETWTVTVTAPDGPSTVLHVTRETPRMLVKQEIQGQPVTVELEGTGGADGGGG